MQALTIRRRREIVGSVPGALRGGGCQPIGRRPTAAVRLALLAALSTPLGLLAQRPADAAIPVAQQYDPVAGGYRPAVLEPLPPPAVRAIQQALAEAGVSPGPVTGVLETRTRAALRDFQAARGLRLSGRPDYDTVVTLGLPVRPATPDELARAPAYPRPYDVVIIGPPDSLLPPVGGVGVSPGGDAGPPPVGSGANTAPDPGVGPVPNPGVGPAPSAGVPVLPAPGAAPGSAPGMIVLPAPPPPASAEPASPPASPEAAPPLASPVSPPPPAPPGVAPPSGSRETAPPPAAPEHRPTDAPSAPTR